MRFGSPVVAVNFDHGEGQDYNVISHFWAKSSATPTLTHREPYDEFLRKGMKLGEDAVAEIVKKSGVRTDQINFGMLQSAATAMELLANLCVRAVHLNEKQAALVS